VDWGDRERHEVIMVKKTLPVRGDVSFEELKKVNEYVAEYWSARELQPLVVLLSA
jgi:hypothetical protein